VPKRCDGKGLGLGPLTVRIGGRPGPAVGVQGYLEWPRVPDGVILAPSPMTDPRSRLAVAVTLALATATAAPPAIAQQSQAMRSDCRTAQRDTPARRQRAEQ
jgi:hypothetical protein